MSDTIAGFITTQPVTDAYETTVHWTAPDAPVDREAFIRAVVKRFERELRNYIGE